jgi:hypothetical protein
MSRAFFWRLDMNSMRQATIAARAATNVLQSVTAICVGLIALEGILSDEQRAARSKLLEDVLLTERLTQMLKERAEALSGTLSQARQRKVAQCPWAPAYHAFASHEICVGLRIGKK